MRAFIAIAIASLPGLGFGCGGDDGGGGTCGPGSASASGLTASGSGVTFTYAGLTEGPNNDCTPKGSAIISVTIQTPESDVSQYVALCIPRPNDLGIDLALGSDAPGDEPPVIVEGVAGTTTDGCFYLYDPTGPITGSLHATGVCADGAGSAGFALVVDATISMVGTGSSSCAAGDVTFQLAGTVAVAGGD